MKKSFIIFLFIAFMVIVHSSCAKIGVSDVISSPAPTEIQTDLPASSVPRPIISLRPKIPQDAITGSQTDGSEYNSFNILFPSQAPVGLENEPAYNVTPFYLSFRLPDGWYCLKQPVSRELYLDAAESDNLRVGIVHSVFYIYNDSDVCIGAFGYDAYDASDDHDSSPDYNVIYKKINQNKDYRFTTAEYYFAVESPYSSNVTAITQVFYSQEKLHSHGFWNAFDKLNVGIVSYMKNPKVYVAFEFFTSALTAGDLMTVAGSISMRPATYSGGY